MEYNQGRKAFYAGLRTQDNPYLPSSYKFVDWQCGFLDAKHRSEGKTAFETITLLSNINKGP
jgi:hypothetical protein